MHTIESSPPPVFNTLKVEILNNDKFQQFLPNSREPIPFETEVFKGVTFIVVRTDPYDTPYQHFFIGRRFVLSLKSYIYIYIYVLIYLFILLFYII